MKSMKQILAILACLFLGVSLAVAQEPQLARRSPDTSSREITIVIQQKQLRFTAPASTQELRLEVLNNTGESVYDSGLVTGAEISWALRNVSGGEIPSGLYAYTLTIKETDSEAPATRRGHLILERGRDQLWVTNEGAIGTEESPSGGELTVSSGAEASLAGARIVKDGASVMAPNAKPLEQVTHDTTLVGDGTMTSPLGIANGGVTGTKIAAGQVVKSLNGLTDNVSLTAGTNITITPSGNSLNIAAPNLLGSVTHDATLAGNGTSAAPLRIALPLSLSGSGGVSVTNSQSLGSGLFGEGYAGVQGRGVDRNNSLAGWGMFATGGFSDSFRGGAGMEAVGGASNSGSGGWGMVAWGGNSNSGDGSAGVSGIGGNSDSGGGGLGVFGQGGRTNSGFNGDGVSGSGGGSDTVRGGNGIVGFRGLSPVGNGLAGLFYGDVTVNGNLSKSGGSFKIDHPLDPANKYLYHSFVESPDMMNVYNGNITTDSNGDATVTLPDYFEALNRDFRYQLTVIGQFAQAIVGSEISGNRFTIKTDRPGVKVSWQVTGIRQDAYANKHRIPVEEEKPERERGYFLHPQVFDQPEEKSLEWARNPEMMRQIKSRRQDAEAQKREKKNDR